MKFTPEVGKEIIAALTAKLPDKKLRPCAVCNALSWQLLDAFITLTISDEPQLVQLGGNIMPNTVLVCRNCGNTHLLNLNALGLTHLLKPDPVTMDADPMLVRLPDVAATGEGGKD